MTWEAQLVFALVLIVVIGWAVGWFFGRNTEEPRVDPDELTRQQRMMDGEE